MLLVLEYRPPISSSVSNEKILKCRVHFFFFTAKGTFSIESPGSCLCFFLLLRTHRIANTIAAKATTTTGTAIAAFVPDDILLPVDCAKVEVVLATSDVKEEVTALDAAEVITVSERAVVVAAVVVGSDADEDEAGSADEALDVEAADTDAAVVVSVVAVVVGAREDVVRVVGDLSADSLAANDDSMASEAPPGGPVGLSLIAFALIVLKRPETLGSWKLV